MDILVTYDIADTETTGSSRLRRIADVCERYGQRVQLSVFECRLSSTRLARMIGEIHDVIDHDIDSVIIYQFPRGVEESALRLGREGAHALGKPWVL